MDYLCHTRKKAFECIVVKGQNDRNQHFLLSLQSFAQPHSSLGSVAELRTGRCFDLWLTQFSFRGLMIIIVTGFIPLTFVRCFNNGYVGKQPVACKKYVEYWLKELQESMGRCTGCHDTAKILLKMALNTMQWINQPSNVFFPLEDRFKNLIHI